MGRIGFQELILIFGVALLIFGPSKLPELGKSLGKGLREFRKATESALEDDTPEPVNKTEKTEKEEEE